MSIKKRIIISIALWETEMDVNIFISKPLLLKIELHACYKELQRSEASFTVVLSRQ